MLRSIVVFLCLYTLCNGCKFMNIIHYDSYKGTPISDKEYKEYIKKNNTFWCVNDIQPCDPNEWRRIDGSCNNLKHPTYGAMHTPLVKVLPSVYDAGYEPRKAKDGADLPLPRYLRTSLLLEGKVPDQMLTQLATNLLTFISSEVTSVQDTINYVLWKPYCCEPRGKADRSCTPNKIPNDDPVHRFSSIRCLNLTRPESFQSMGCVRNDTTPDRILSSTSTLDLSTLYGGNLDMLKKMARTFQNGLLKTEIEEGREWPPSTKSKTDICLQNQKPAETRCHSTPEVGSNSLFAVNLFVIWFWRNHNFIAKSLAKVNPCWDDDQLFYAARDVNIAIYLQISFYELLPILMGRKNMIMNNLISKLSGFRDLYNDKILPQQSIEMAAVLRWFHTMQEGSLKMYDVDGTYLKAFPVVNLTLRTGFLAVDNNIDYLTQGSFRQPCGKADYIVDPDIAEVGLGTLQQAFDIPTSDLTKHRYFGFQPYVKYLEYCNRQKYESFEDLLDVMDPERVEMLRDRYNHIEDIDLMAGIWLEKHVRGGRIPSTLFCLITEQLGRTIASDRHWYERQDRPHAFTLQQLLEIRKATISRLICDVGDKVTQIQPKGFLRAGPGNEMCSCNSIRSIDFNAWADPQCVVNKRNK
ncbi:hypothetical protein ACJJTC_010692 [Scirpophaga incertulas]